jgi:hypothetical protein
MKQKYFILLILVLSLIPNVVSCPPSQREYLFVKEITSSSEDFYFLDNYLNKTNFSRRYRAQFPYFRYFNYSGDPQYLKITINNEELVNIERSSLKGSTVMENQETGEVETITINNFPSEKIFEKLYMPTWEQDTLIDYNNSNVKIFLDDKLVREFSMGYQPAIIKKCGPYIPTSFIITALVIAILIISTITFIILKIIRKRY